MARIGINGFGRIGRQVVRAILEQQPSLEVVAVNDLTDVRTNAHLFQYDSTYGRLHGSVEAQHGRIVINGRRIDVLSERDLARVPLRDHGVERVVESTGRFMDVKNASGLLEGV